MKRNQKQKKYRKLPQHSWEAHPLAKSGEARKTFQVALISVVVLVVLVLLFFTLKVKVVGKAFFTEQANTAGLPDEGSVSLNTAFSRTVRAALAPGGETLALAFTLSLPPGVTCNGIQSLLGWSDGLVLDTAACAGNQVNFEYASLNPNEVKSGTFDVARINFNGVAAAGTYVLDFTSFDVINLNEASQDFIGEGLDAELTVTAAPAVCTPQPEACDGLDNDCDGQVDEAVAGNPLCNTKQHCGTFSKACEADESCLKGECKEMIVASDAFSHLGSIPEKYTCNGAKVNPPLTISNIPSGTNSLALILEDLDYKPNNLPYVHWSVLNIPVPSGATLVVISENAKNLDVQPNDVSKQKKYDGPCPPGKENHHYRFKAYALSIQTVQASSVDDASAIVRTSTLEKALEKSILLDDVLLGVYYPRPTPVVSVEEAQRYGGDGARGKGGNVGWNCPKTWSACFNGQQSRTCTDIFRPAVTRIEKQPCPGKACTESWSCTAWSACGKGQQTRSCTDANQCGTTQQKPAVQQACVVTAPTPSAAPPAPVPKPPSVQVVQQPAAVKAPEVQKPAPFLSLIKEAWQKYKVYVVAVPSTLLLIIVLILLVHHFRKPKVVYNTEELKQWIKAEKAMGTSDEDVKAILAQNTGWSKEEVERAMQEAVSPAARPLATPPSS